MRRIHFMLLLLIFFVGGTGADTLRVMSWNLADMDLFDGDGRGRADDQVAQERAIAQVVRSVGPDILFIPEAPSYVELDAFVRGNNLDYHVVHLRQQSGRRDFADGMAFLARQLPAEAALYTPALRDSTRSEASRYLDWSYRGVAMIRMEHYSVAGVHLKSPWDGKERSYRLRLSQAESLIGFLESIPGPVILLGDFNDAPGLDDKEQTFGVDDTIGLLQNEFLRAQGMGAPTQEKGLNIDHIFIRGGRIGERHTVETDWTLSDHRPVWCDIDFD